VPSAIARSAIACPTSTIAAFSSGVRSSAAPGRPEDALRERAPVVLAADRGDVAAVDAENVALDHVGQPVVRPGRERALVALDRAQRGVAVLGAGASLVNPAPGAGDREICAGHDPVRIPAQLEHPVGPRLALRELLIQRVPLTPFVGVEPTPASVRLERRDLGIQLLDDRLSTSSRRPRRAPTWVGACFDWLC
jgi:hypothetical protein